jgi:hypothetical protein
MPVAAALLILAMQRTRLGILGGFGPPERLICNSINAPAMFFRACAMYLWHRLHLPYEFPEAVVEIAVTVVGVGLLWYLVGLEIDAGRQGRRGILPSMFRWRVALDLALILFGVFLALVGVGSWLILRWTPMYAGIQAGLFFAWALVLVGTYGRDLVRSVIQRIAGEKTA